jgi:hypothetical protein
VATATNAKLFTVPMKKIKSIKDMNGYDYILSNKIHV